ncbi:hypothetical protein, partial [Agrobacterium vitis]|uniref:hypothetical protein n=1 Tax=Agrobacterium vitis TaxID=373 RepID=UPI0018D26936
RNMDRWAFFALILSYISIPINIFGIIFIFCNLVEARKMTNAAIKSSEVGDKTLIEAQKSTKFSEQSVKLAREALFATNRPWIQINCTPASNLIFAEDIIKLEIDVELANIGTAPACNIVIPVRELCPDASIAKEKMHEETKKFKGISKNLLRIVIGEDGFSIFPEQKRSFKFEFNLDKKDFLIRIDELNKIEFEGAEKYYGRSKLAIVLGVLYVIPGDTVDRFTFVSFDIVEKYLSFIGFDASEKIIKNSDIDLICSKAGSYIN